MCARDQACVCVCSFLDKRVRLHTAPNLCVEVARVFAGAPNHTCAHMRPQLRGYGSQGGSSRIGDGWLGQPVVPAFLHSLWFWHVRRETTDMLLNGKPSLPIFFTCFARFPFCHFAWHSFLHIFLHCFWSSFWQSFRHLFWHSFWRIFWHQSLRISWRSVWHSFWHSF